jgi:hypothetical protein
MAADREEGEASGAAKYRKAKPSLEELLKSLNLMEDNDTSQTCL